MIKLTAFLMAFLSTSCAAVQPVLTIKDVFTDPAPVDMIEGIVLSEKRYLCYTTDLGSSVYSDGTVPCEPREVVNRIEQQVAARWDLQGDPRWELTAIFYTSEIILCGEIRAMGCTVGWPDNTAISAVSLFYPWRQATLRHELTHVAFFLKEFPEIRHYCLDNPQDCENGGASLKFMGPI